MLTEEEFIDLRNLKHPNTLYGDPDVWTIEELKNLRPIDRASLQFECWNKWANSLTEPERLTQTTQFDAGVIKSPLERYDINLQDFDDFIFPCRVDFNNCNFIKKTRFNRSEFKEGAMFGNVHFLKGLQIKSANFRKWATFMNPKFRGGLNIKETHFYGECHLGGSTFYESSQIHNSTFHNSVNFSHAKVFKPIQFDNNTFKGFASFGLMLAIAPISWSGSVFETTVSFSRTDFFQSAIFTGVNFLGPAFFEDTCFNELDNLKTLKTELTDEEQQLINVSKQHHKSRNPDFTFSNLTVPLNFDRIKIYKLSTSTMNAAAQCRILKQLAAQSDNHEKELKFFRLELEALSEQLDASKSRIFLTKWYRILSNYGQSVTLPLMWLLGSTFFFAFVYLFWISDRAWASESYISYLKSFLYSLTTSIPTVSSLSETAQSNSQLLFGESKPLILGLLSMFQTLISSILLFLIGLAIRNRFKL